MSPLSRVRKLRVVARTSAFAFKEHNVDFTSLSDLADSIEPVPRSSFCVGHGYDLDLRAGRNEHEGIWKSRQESPPYIEVIWNIHKARKRFRQRADARQHFFDFVE